MRGFDFTSWQGLLFTLVGIALFTLISMGIRLIMMFTIQQRRERVNRQINERLKTLIAAYKTLGGSFTGTLTVDPTHLRDLRAKRAEEGAEGLDLSSGSERSRRIRDAVEAALSDIILLGTEEQVRLAERAARELVAGQPVRTDLLVVSLRNFIREALDLAPVPSDLEVPFQGPARPSSSGGRGRSEGGAGRGGGGGGGGMGAGGGGMGLGAAGEQTTEAADPASR
ncbi:hypothetical protein [Aquamicrobium sp. LC103]|uniref:hypothetical protein n=1 Tax=Aquamicrobium sp. LC103 TaxID=1120658 RepID=UPI00063EB44F|nr:hypothetical protein [Aquamicrobium sp. LC103]TKT76685.1 hypothetical protein XW59_014535 [Aquamicrobium sp. LC103]